MPRLAARRDGDDWVLDGSKSLSFGRDAAATVVFARTGPSEKRGKDISAFLVPLDLPGVTREPAPDMDTKGVGRGLVHLRSVRIPGDHLLGEVDRALTQVIEGFDFTRAIIGLHVPGRRAAEPSTRPGSASARPSAFDRPIGTNQGVAFPLAECATHLAPRRGCSATGRCGARTSTAAQRRGRDGKWWAPKVAFDVDPPVPADPRPDRLPHRGQIEQRLRDVIGLQIGDGTAQITKFVISRPKTTAASSTRQRGEPHGKAGQQDRDRHRGRAGHRPGHRHQAGRRGRHRRRHRPQRGDRQGDRREP